MSLELMEASTNQAVWWHDQCSKNELGVGKELTDQEGGSRRSLEDAISCWQKDELVEVWSVQWIRCNKE